MNGCGDETRADVPRTLVVATKMMCFQPFDHFHNRCSSPGPTTLVLSALPQKQNSVPAVAGVDADEALPYW